MTIEQMIEVMQAYDEGKEIQYKPVAGGSWHDEAEPSWNFSILDYRIKPDSKYRPYKDTEEMIADWKKRFNAKDWPSYSMPLIWIWDKDNAEKTFVTGFRRQEVNTVDAIINMASLLQSYTYLDGSPCGKEVTE